MDPKEEIKKLKKEIEDIDDVVGELGIGLHLKRKAKKEAQLEIRKLLCLIADKKNKVGMMRYNSEMEEEDKKFEIKTYYGFHIRDGMEVFFGAFDSMELVKTAVNLNIPTAVWSGYTFVAGRPNEIFGRVEIYEKNVINPVGLITAHPTTDLNGWG